MDELLQLGEYIAASDLAKASAETRRTVDQAARSSLTCALLGLEREGWVWDFPRRAATGSGKASGSVKLLASLFDVFDGVGHMGLAAGAADCDPMDPGPSHSAIPATLASCVTLTAGGASHSAAAADHLVGSSVLAGIEAAMRMRRCISGTRPGVGYHSPGVYGAVAAAAAAARALNLGARECANAVAIAIDRSAGLGINSAATLVGVTHFGWGTIHGLEAALLAAEGWPASHDMGRALSTLFAGSQIDLSAMVTQYPLSVTEALVFKWYPCNIYTNLAVLMLENLDERTVDAVEITMPWIPHLDCPEPRNVRQARNSAQAVAAIAAAGDTSYAAFSGPGGRWEPTAKVAQLLSRIRLTMDRSLPTNLDAAEVGVRVQRNSKIILEARKSMKDLHGWGREHAKRLMGSEDQRGSIDALYGSSIVEGFRHVQNRREALLTEGSRT